MLLIELVQLQRALGAEMPSSTQSDLVIPKGLGDIETACRRKCLQDLPALKWEISYFSDRLHHGGGTRKGSTRANTKAAEDTEMYQGHEGKPRMLGS